MSSGRKKHIIICSTSFYETDRRIIRISESLVKDGFSVSWISRIHKQSSPQIHGVSHIIIHTLFKRGPLFYLEYNWRIWSKLRKHRDSIVCAVDLDTIPGVYLGGNSRKNILAHDAHEIYYEVPELTNRKFKKRIWKTVANFFLPKIRYNYTVNTSLSQHYASNYGTKYEVIRNITPKPDLELKPKEFNKVIAYLGVLNKGRGVEIAIDAMKERSDYTLLLLGEGDYSNELRKQAEGMANVKFKGLVPPSQIFQMLAKADIGLNILSADSLNYKLSLANKFFDYLYASLPSINMAYPEYNQILTNHPIGIMIESYTTEALIEGLDKISNPTFYSELKANCKRYRENYSWKNEEEKLLTLYNRLNEIDS